MAYKEGANLIVCEKNNGLPIPAILYKKGTRWVVFSEYYNFRTYASKVKVLGPVVEFGKMLEPGPYKLWVKDCLKPVLGFAYHSNVGGYETTNFMLMVQIGNLQPRTLALDSKEVVIIKILKKLLT